MKIDNSVKALAISSIFSLCFLVKSIFEQRYSTAGLMAIYLIGGLIATYQWIKSK